MRQETLNVILVGTFEGKKPLGRTDMGKRVKLEIIFKKLENF